MADSRHHSPVTGKGTSTRGKPQGGGVPSNVGASWPGKAAFLPHAGTLRRKAKPTHPDCATDTRPHRALTRQWLRDGFTLGDARTFVRTKLAEGDALGVRALQVYSKMRNVPEEREPQAARFPLTTRDRLHNVRGRSILENIDDA